MTAATRRRFLLASTVALAWALPLAFFALLLLFNPYAILSAAEFAVANSLGEAIAVTPMAVVRLASGEYAWKVVPQLAVPGLAAPPRREVAIPIAPGQSVTIRGNFDDVSLAAIAVEAAGQPPQMLVVDRTAAIGACCYAPKVRQFVVTKEALEPGSRKLADTVAKAKEADRVAGWYAWVGSGLAVGVLFVLSLLAWLATGRRADSPA
ncbi:MAG: hypothetical protein KIS74_13610 [Burkholderiales bacterium]|nr:hypothetical protein [Burkholderiales bacterium]